MSVTDTFIKNLNLTKEQAIKEHRKMWNWLADETERRQKIQNKMDYFDSMNISNDNIPECHCYLCQYAGEKTNPMGYLDDIMFTKDCSLCPIKWDTVSKKCFEGAGLYNRWRKYKKDGDLKNFVETCREIANLPEKENDQNE